MTKRKGRIKGSKNGVHAIKRSREEAEKLFLDNMKLVPYIANRMDIKVTDDVIQDGYIGLWKAALWYDDSRSQKFATYAVPAIRNSIILAWRRASVSVQADCSLNQAVLYDKDDDEPRRELQEIIPDEKAEVPMRDVEFEIYLDSILTETEKRAASMRTDGCTYQKIGDAFGYTDMWAIYRVRDAKKKLKAEYAERKINLGKT